jgi:hypothetical protein
MTAGAQNVAQISTLGDESAVNLAANWIHDSDPRRRAWAAELIADRHFEILYPQLRTALSELQPNPAGKFQSAPEEIAIEVIADAIIRTGVAVPGIEARKLYPEFPALAMILLSRAPIDSHDSLTSILTDSKIGEVWLAAADLLSTKPTPDFAIGQLDQFNIFLRILVAERGIGIGAGYGDCFLPGPARQSKVAGDWPPLRIYSLKITQAKENLIANGLNSVSFETRIAADAAPWTRRADCSGPDIQKLRRDLLVQLAGIDAASMPLQAVVLRGIVRENDDQYIRDATRIIQEQAATFGDLLSKLQSRRLLTPADVMHRRLHMHVRLIGVRSDRPLPALPDLTLLGIDGEYHVSY